MSCPRGCCDSYREHVLSISISASALPSKNGPMSAYAIQKKEDQWDRDLPAYKRLRDEGMQPKGIDGCADLEQKAETKVEVESGYPMNARQRSQYDEVMERVELPSP